MSMRSILPWALVLCATATWLGISHDPSEDSPAPTAGDQQPTATLAFNVTDADGKSIPARLTFIGEKGNGANLFPNANAAPDDLAVRSNIIYTVTGKGAVTVPPGKYTIYASRGLEWSIDQSDVELTADKTATFAATLKHEVDTTGWVSGDFHLHTLTHSGHGDANMKERVITFLGEGLEFAVATDHNHNTDYGPTVNELGVGEHLTTVTGNEVTTPIGHLNTFPLDPERPIPPYDTHDAKKLFKVIREETNKYGVTPVIQLNHPRWYSIDFFRHTGLDAITGVSQSDSYSDNFDSLEVFNENAGWGYFDADSPQAFNTGSGRHWVLHDWCNLLNRGHRYAAVGNSDSHTVYSDYAGYPRNFVPSSTDEPDKISVKEVTDAIRGKRLFTTIGPFVQYTANGKPMGSDVAATDGDVELHIRAQAASWIDCDRIKVLVNGDIVETLPVKDTRKIIRFDDTVKLHLKRDSWVALLVEGDDSLAPILHDSDRPILPLAVCNPVWIDADGDGKWTSPWEQALAIARSDDPTAVETAMKDGRTANERSQLVLAAAEVKNANASEQVRAALRDRDRFVQLAAARAAEQLADAQLLADAEAAYEHAKDDTYLRVGMLRAIHACSPKAATDRVLAFIDDIGEKKTAQHMDELTTLMPGEFVRDWQVVGYFPNPEQSTLVTTAYGPEKNADDDASYEGKGGVSVKWQAMTGRDDGYLDLRRIDRKSYENSIAYAATYVHSATDHTVRYAIGADDGCRLWVNGDMLYEDNTRHSASPFQHIGEMALHVGWNRVLIKVENGASYFGLYFRVLDDDVRTAAMRSGD